MLDVGTSKVAAMLVLIGGDGGDPRVIGVGQRICHGMRRGVVGDMEKVEGAIRAAMDQAERNAGTQAERVFASLSAGGLESEVVPVEIDIAGHRIAKADMATLTGAARGRIDPGTRSVLHAQPAYYLIDGQPVDAPLGFHANRLGMDIHVVTAEMPPLRNLDLAIRNAHLGVETIVAAPVAASLACLAREEREIGVALVEIGAGVTTIGVHAGGQLVGVGAVPLGAGDITNDIAAAFATKRIHAERLKTMHGAAITSPKDNHDPVDIPPISDEDGADPQRISKAQLIGVIRQRLDQLFTEIAKCLTAQGFTGPQARQVVLTGGGAELGAIADFAQGALGRSVRIGRPRGLTGLPGAQQGAAFSTLAGLALFAAAEVPDLWHQRGGVTGADVAKAEVGRWRATWQKLRSSL